MSNDPLTEVSFWAQVLTDAERTVVCSPENESRIKTWVATRGLSGSITVLVSPIVRDDQLIVMDPHAFDAMRAQREQRTPLPRLFPY